MLPAGETIRIFIVIFFSNVILNEVKDLSFFHNGNTLKERKFTEKFDIIQP